jgi:hypothetical protein
MDVYGTETPPEYDLSSFNIPVAIASGDVDVLADPTDVSWLLG